MSIIFVELRHNSVICLVTFEIGKGFSLLDEMGKPNSFSSDLFGIARRIPHVSWKLNWLQQKSSKTFFFRKRRLNLINDVTTDIPS